MYLFPNIFSLPENAVNCLKKIVNYTLLIYTGLFLGYDKLLLRKNAKKGELLCVKFQRSTPTLI